MITEEIEKKKMDQIRELSDTGLKISEAKNTLFKLQEDETLYLQEREQKALDKITALLEESQDILAQTSENYDEIHALCQEVTSFCDFLTQAHASFQDMLSEFSLRSDKWDIEVASQQGKFDEIKKNLALQKTNIENDKKTIASEWVKIGEEKALIASRQQQIKVALSVLEKKQNG